MKWVYMLIGLVMLGILAAPVLFVVGVIIWAVVATAQTPTWESFANGVRTCFLFAFWAVMLFSFLFAGLWLAGGAKTE